MAKPVEQNVEFESVSLHPDNFQEGRIDNVDAAIVNAYFIPYRFPKGKYWSVFAKIFFKCSPEYDNKEFSEIYEAGRLDTLFPAMKDKKGKFVLTGGATVEQWRALAEAGIDGKVDDPDAFKGYFLARAVGSRAQPATRNFHNFQNQLRKVHPDPEAPNDPTRTSFNFSDDIRDLVNPDKYYRLSQLSFDTRKEEQLKPGEKLFKILVPVEVVSVDEEEEEKPKKGAAKSAVKKVKDEEEEIELDELEELEEEEEEEEGEEEEEEDEIEEEEEEEEEDDNDVEAIAAKQVVKALKAGPINHASLVPKVMASVDELISDMPAKKGKMVRSGVLEKLNSPKWVTAKNRPWNFNADTKKYSVKK